MAVINAKTYGDTVIEIARVLYGSQFFPHDETPAATGGSTTTLVDTKYQNSIYPDDHFNKWELGVYSKFVTPITDWATGTGTLTFATQGSAAAAADKYWVLNRAGWSTAQIKAAIRLALEEASRHRARSPKVSQALAYQRGRTLYPIPSGFSGIHRVYVDTRTNYLARNPSGKFDTLTSLKSASTTNVKLAQSFKVSDTNPSFQLGDLYLLLAKLGSPTGNLTVTIESDSSSAPDGTALATSATVDVTTLTTEPTYTRFTFSAKPILTADTTYWIVLSTTTSASSTVCAVWANDSTEADYGDGSAMTHNNTSWSALTGDLIFSIRAPYPNLHLLENRKHIDVVRDTTRYLRITKIGESWFEQNEQDGAVIHLEGLGPPAMPTVDSDTLEVPYGFVLAHACLQLIADNSQYWQRQPGAATKPRFWEAQVNTIALHLPGQTPPGLMAVEDM